MQEDCDPMCHPRSRIEKFAQTYDYVTAFSLIDKRSDGCSALASGGGMSAFESQPPHGSAPLASSSTSPPLAKSLTSIN